LGSLLSNRLLGGKVSARIVPWGALGIGLFSIDLWLASPAPATAGDLAGLGAFLGDPPHWRILVDLLGIALSGGVFVVPLYALLQAASPRQRRAQAIAANNVINAAAMVAASVATMGLLAAGVSVPALFLLTGSLTLAVALLSWRSLPSFAFNPKLSETPYR
jgi:acyl-[acyl-carrier-protein]-phospholipid O-acyltransferase/long-chain-fatty-acid--[acyl-carrier-protein] ligase